MEKMSQDFSRIFKGLLPNHVLIILFAPSALSSRVSGDVRVKVVLDPTTRPPHVESTILPSDVLQHVAKAIATFAPGPGTQGLFGARPKVESRAGGSGPGTSGPCRPGAACEW